MSGSEWWFLGLPFKGSGALCHKANQDGLVTLGEIPSEVGKQGEHEMDLGDFSTEWKPETVTRNEGVTPEEQYLQRLCDSSFLSLWSYAGPSRDSKADGKGDGKELCEVPVPSDD
jgi:hypothetical protein